MLPANKPYLPLLPGRRALPPFGWYSFYRPTEGRRLSRPGWLVTYRNKVPPPVTHPSTNRAQRTLTSLIETNVLPLRQTAKPPPPRPQLLSENAAEAAALQVLSEWDASIRTVISRVLDGRPTWWKRVLKVSSTTWSWKLACSAPTSATRKEFHRFRSTVDKAAPVWYDTLIKNYACYIYTSITCQWRIQVVPSRPCLQFFLGWTENAGVKTERGTKIGGGAGKHRSARKTEEDLLLKAKYDVKA